MVIKSIFFQRKRQCTEVKNVRCLSLLNSNRVYITVDGTFLAIRDKKTDTYLAIDTGVPRIDIKTLNGIKHYKLTEI